MNEQREYATIQVVKRKGGRSRITNHSHRGIFFYGATYYNHQLKGYPENAALNVTIRLSPTGRRMVQEIREKK